LIGSFTFTRIHIKTDLIIETGETCNAGNYHRRASTPDMFRNNNAVRVKPRDRECAHSSGPIIQLERYTSGAFSTYYNGAQKHVRNEQTFPEYLLPRALEKIWETPSLENE